MSLVNVNGMAAEGYYYDEFGNECYSRGRGGPRAVGGFDDGTEGGTVYVPETEEEKYYAEDVYAPEITERVVIDNPFRYAGYEYIEEVKLYDLNARYYNPEIARFLSQDSYYDLGNRVIGLYEINVPTAASIMQANNRYVYCGNNPIKYVDPSGEAVLTLSVGGALLAKAAPYIIAGVAAIGTIMFAEHHKKGTTNPSNLPKHQKGQKRKQTDKYGGEKGDARRTPRKDKKK